MLERVDLKRIERALARKCMADFATYTDPRYKMNWHHALLCDYLDRFVAKEIKRLLVFMPPRHGKALEVHTPIPTTDGWVEIGKLKPGDLVFDENGQPVRVTAVSPTWKNRPVYKVSTDDGDEIIADAAHEWLVRLCRKRKVFNKYETAFLANRASDRKPMCQAAKALNLPHIDLPIDPYVLGVWLGDGRSNSGAFCSPDDEIIDEVVKIEGQGSFYAERNGVKHFRPGVKTNAKKKNPASLFERLKALNLINNKHIPPQYLRASAEQRLRLLQGLIDTDGYVADDGQIEFCTVLPELAHAVREIVHSLGHKASIIEGESKLNRVSYGKKYRVLFYMQNAALLLRKRNKTRNGDHYYRRFLSFEFAGYADTVCIEVESDTHMFLCGKSMLPTCNSELVSRKLPAFIFGKNPDAKIIATSYSADLAQAMNRDVQRIIESEAYADAFPETYLFGKNIRSVAGGNYLRNSDIFEIVNHQGSYRGAGVGGGITGMGGDYIIIDDPIKNRDEANSSTYRQKTWDWYISTLYTRLEGDASLLVTLTRWHEDDLAGRLIEASKIPGGDEWVILSLPAIREEGYADHDRRNIGEPLWADKYSIKDLERIKITIGSYEWNALYQQRPAPQEGAMFKREWWQQWQVIPGDLFDFLQSWDCTFKDKSTSDFVVGQVWARSKKNPANRYLLDQVRARMSFTETVAAIRRLSAKWPKVTRKLIEDKANGTAVIDTLKTSIPGIVPVEPKGGKVVRAHAVTAVVEAGNVYIPATAPWVNDFVEELAAFPSATHDDQVDAMTQANAWYNDKSSFNIRNLI